MPVMLEQGLAQCELAQVQPQPHPCQDATEAPVAVPFVAWSAAEWPAWPPWCIACGSAICDGIRCPACEASSAALAVVLPA